MAKFNPAADMDKYAPTGNYFSLKNDKETAMVHFMFNSIEDVDGYSVHEVEVNGSRKLVNCLREYADPLSACPLCEAHYKLITKFFVPLHVIDRDEVVIWERGRLFYSKLQELCSQCNPLVSYPIEIERNGEAGDQNTTYEMYVQECDNTLLEDLPEVPEIFGTFIWNKSYDELLTFVQTGSFVTGDANPVNQSNNTDVRRRRDVSVNSVARRRGSGTSDIPL
jgi:hypothetical protein